MLIILENEGGAESRAVRMASMLSADIRVSNATLAGLEGHQEALLDGALPVGTVAFVQRAMALAGMGEPGNLSYPLEARRYLKRKLWHTTACRALSAPGKRFIKSAATKLFTGFVLDAKVGVAGLNAHDKLQFEALSRLPAETPVWVSEPVDWVSEYRYYIQDAELIGYARYDQGDAEVVPEPNPVVVKLCILGLQIRHPYVLDMGVIASGETAMVEVNDAWAIGLYAGALQPRQYVEFLATRWESLRNRIVI